jgi:hypothetical protein
MTTNQPVSKVNAINKKMALILASIAVTFFVAIIIKRLVFG